MSADSQSNIAISSHVPTFICKALTASPLSHMWKQINRKLSKNVLPRPKHTFTHDTQTAENILDLGYARREKNNIILLVVCSHFHNCICATHSIFKLRTVLLTFDSKKFCIVCPTQIECVFVFMWWICIPFPRSNDIQILIFVSSHTHTQFQPIKYVLHSINYSSVVWFIWIGFMFGGFFPRSLFNILLINLLSFYFECIRWQKRNTFFVISFRFPNHLCV